MRLFLHGARMLILTRRPGEIVTIGDKIRVTVIASERGQVKLGIDAPRDVPVHRLEIANKIAAEKGELTYDEINELRERIGGK